MEADEWGGRRGGRRAGWGGGGGWGGVGGGGELTSVGESCYRWVKVATGCGGRASSTGNGAGHRDGAADVVVVGYGPAGACAAITAHDLGRSVVVVESAGRGG